MGELGYHIYSDFPWGKHEPNLSPQMINYSISKPSQKVLSQYISLLNNSWENLFLIPVPPDSENPCNSCSAAPPMHMIPCIIIGT